jgi:hypothetical protein
MRKGRGITAVVVAVALVASVAPAAALGIDGVRQGLGDERAAASARVVAGGSLVADMLARLGELFTSLWGAARGSIVPGADGTSTVTAAPESGGE